MTRQTSSSLVILTGAGVSAESGIRTFRGGDGLWENHRLEDVATPEAFARDPHLVHRFYNERRKQLSLVKPNAAHLALAELEEKWNGDFLLITQNVDDLHERAGSQKLVHMHGELLSAFCRACAHKLRLQNDLSVNDSCPQCSKTQSLRPDIVWFGEMPYHMQQIERALEEADVFVAIGTSGQVYPAAGFAAWATRAHRVEINADSTTVTSLFDEHRRGPAGTEVPRWVDEILSRN